MLLPDSQRSVWSRSFVEVQGLGFVSSPKTVRFRAAAAPLGSGTCLEAYTLYHADLAGVIRDQYLSRWTS